MKLAIASTTLLFAMMAAQAAVLSATSNTGVNLVKRAPNGDDETGQALQSISLAQSQLPKPPSRNMKNHGWKSYMTKQECEKKPSFVRIRARAKIAEFKKTLVELEEKLVEFEQQLKTVMEKYKKTTDVYLGLNQARRLQSYGLLRQYIRNQ
ncbi:hypothetical protein BASA60_011182 [Batrachochytrium salamandrivorans]|nr:hypothetical protein BASA60_011182 [Batrachochytrium salamandrivorans]